MFNNWQTEAIKESLELRYKVKAISDSMNWLFPYQTQERRFFIENKTGNKIFFKISYKKKNQLEIYAEGHSIFVSINKKPSIIVRDIKARLFPLARKTLLELKAEKQKRKTKFLERLVVMLKISKIFGKKYISPINDRKPYILKFNTDIQNIEVTQNWYDEIIVDFNIRLNEEKAIKLSNFLKDL